MFKIKVHEARDRFQHTKYVSGPAPQGYTMIYNNLPVYVSNDIFPKLEYSLWHGDRKNEKVLFRYYNEKTDTYSDKTHLTYEQALKLALSRARDGRYRNYEYYIELLDK